MIKTPQIINDITTKIISIPMKSLPSIVLKTLPLCKIDEPIEKS
jgi:hypothetical protein